MRKVIKWGMFVFGWVAIDYATWHLSLPMYLLVQLGALNLFISGAIQ